MGWKKNRVIEVAPLSVEERLQETINSLHLRLDSLGNKLILAESSKNKWEANKKRAEEALKVVVHNKAAMETLYQQAAKHFDVYAQEMTELKSLEAKIRDQKAIADVTYERMTRFVRTQELKNRIDGGLMALDSGPTVDAIAQKTSIETVDNGSIDEKKVLELIYTAQALMELTNDSVASENSVSS